MTAANVVDAPGATGAASDLASFGVPGRPIDLPPVYEGVDDAACRHQRSYGLLLRGHLVLLVLAAAAAGSATHVGHGLAPLLLFAALAFRYQATKSRDQWHRSRALAERVVSLSWLYVLSVPPFDVRDADTVLSERCHAVVSAIPGLGVSRDDADLEPTREMRVLRGLDPHSRVAAYVERRLDEQAVGYYGRKIPFFASRARIFRRLVAAGTLVTAGILVAQAGIEWEPDVGGILVTGLASTEAWVASRRYSEFATLYATTRAVLGRQRAVLVEANDRRLASALGLAADCEQSLALEQVEWLGMLSFDLQHRVRPVVGGDGVSASHSGDRSRISASQAHAMLRGAASYDRVGACVSARQLTSGTSLTLATGDEVVGSAGDWVVEGPTGTRVVAERVFAQTYVEQSPGVYRPTGSVVAVQLTAAADVETLEGWVSAGVGDWLVQNPSGECWPVSAKHFTSSYAPASSRTA